VFKKIPDTAKYGALFSIISLSIFNVSFIITAAKVKNIFEITKLSKTLGGDYFQLSIKNITFAGNLYNIGMNKILFFVSGMIAMLVLSAGCKNEKSMQELIQEEKKAIDRYIANNRLNVINHFPEDGKFDEKQYFKTSEGVYFRVDSFNVDRMAEENNGVTVRVKSIHYIAVSDTSIYSLESVQPYSFTYGMSTTYSSDFCPAWAIPLKYVGEYSIVDMLVPSSYGTSSNRSSFIPVFYKGVTYTSVDAPR
jgi:hypothetical protein